MVFIRLVVAVFAVSLWLSFEVSGASAAAAAMDRVASMPSYRPARATRGRAMFKTIQK